mgnify:CR=1 FL=1
MAISRICSSGSRPCIHSRSEAGKVARYSFQRWVIACVDEVFASAARRPFLPGGGLSGCGAKNGAQRAPCNWRRPGVGAGDDGLPGSGWRPARPRQCGPAIPARAASCGSSGKDAWLLKRIQNLSWVRKAPTRACGVADASPGRKRLARACLQLAPCGPSRSAALTARR